MFYGRAAGGGIGRTASSDFSSFGPLEVVLDASGDAPPNGGLCNPHVFKYGNVYLMLPSVLRKDTGTLDIRLAVSRDGIKWTWPERDVPFIPLGAEGEFDSGSLYMGQGWWVVNGDVWMYYVGSPLKSATSGLEDAVTPRNGRVYSRAVVSWGRFVSVDVGKETGYFVTPPLRFKGKALTLNVDVRPGGVVRIGILYENGEPVQGRSIEDCIPIKDNDYSGTVQWVYGGGEKSFEINPETGGRILSEEKYGVGGFVGVPIRLRFEMTNASLYSFRFSYPRSALEYVGLW